MAETFIGARNPRNVPYSPQRRRWLSLFPTREEKREAYEQATEAAGLGRGVYSSIMLQADPEYARRVEEAIDPVKRQIAAGETASVLALGMASAPTKVPGIVAGVRTRAESLLGKIAADPKVSSASKARVQRVFEKAKANERFDTTVWPAFQKNLPKITRGLQEEAELIGDPVIGGLSIPVKFVQGIARVNQKPVEILATKFFPLPTTATGKVESFVGRYGTTALVDYGFYKAYGGIADRLRKAKGKKSAAGAPEGSGEEMLKQNVSDQLDRNTDEYIMTTALGELNASGGTDNPEAVKAFHSRTGAIRDKAMARLYPEWNQGISFDADREVYETFRDTDVGRAAGARLKESLRRLNEMDPTEWVRGGR